MIILLICPAKAQIIKICKFKAVEIPFNLKYNGSVLKKGKYDLELIRHQTSRIFYLRIRQKGKAFCIVTGEKLEYESDKGISELLDEIPEQPTLKIKKIPKKNMVNIIIESGIKAPNYPYVKVSFKMEYEL